MKINSKNIPIYYLNPDSSDFDYRRQNMEKLLPSLEMSYERFPSNDTSTERIVRVCVGQTNLFNYAIQKNVFPFLFLEDDVELNCKIPQYINIPEESNIIYWGASTYECGAFKENLKIVDYDVDYYKIENSLSTHAFLIPSLKSALYYLTILKKAIDTKSYMDIILAIDSKNQLFLTPKDGPYFYQNDPHTKPITKFLWSDIYSSQENIK